MAAKKETLIALELERFERKIKEFQDYLDSNNINNISDDMTRYKEIDTQRNLMKDIGTLLGQLGSLREQEEKSVSTRGDVKINRRLRDGDYK